MLQKIQGTVETAHATDDRTVDTDAQPFDKFDAMPELKRATRLTNTQKQTDALKKFEGRKIEVVYIEDSKDDLEPATLDAIDHNITDDYTLEQGVPFEGIIEVVTKKYAKVRFVDDSVVKNMNLFNEFERSMLRPRIHQLLLSCRHHHWLGPHSVRLRRKLCRPQGLLLLHSRLLLSQWWVRVQHNQRWVFRLHHPVLLRN